MPIYVKVLPPTPETCTHSIRSAAKQQHMALRWKRMEILGRCRDRSRRTTNHMCIHI